MSDRGKMIIGVIIIILVLVGCVNLCSDGGSSSSSSSSTCSYCGKSGAHKYDCYVSGNYWQTVYLCNSCKSSLLSNNVTVKRVY